MQYPKWLNDFVNNVSSDLGDRDDYSSTYLIGWFLDPANLGYLNNQIDGCYEVTPYLSNAGKVTGIGIEPQLGNQEQSIYKANFDTFFYGREAKMALSGSYNIGAWTTLKEGNSTITRVNRSELARTYQGFRKDAQDNANNLVKQYLKSKSKAQSVDGTDVVDGGYWAEANRSVYYPRSEPGL
jgi:hypothetical protein